MISVGLLLTMFSTTVVTLVMSLYAVEILAVDDDCPTPPRPYDGNPTENCYDLNKKPSEFTFSEYTVPVNNKRGVYKFKNFSVFL